MSNDGCLCASYEAKRIIGEKEREIKKEKIKRNGRMRRIRESNKSCERGRGRKRLRK